MMHHRVAIVTGAGQGIGRATAEHFLTKGLRVVIAEMDEEAGRETEEELAPFGPVLFVKTDVADEESVKEMVAATVERFGRIDFLINNAGVMDDGYLDISLEQWNRIIGIDLTGPFLCSRHAAPHLRNSKGAIVNISSIRALMSEANTLPYSAAKGGLIALTHALALTLGPDVRVNCISPGWIETAEWKKKAERKEPNLSAKDHAQHPVGRVGKPQDVAAMAYFLISDESGFITGANFVVDGGMTRKMIYVED